MHVLHPFYYPELAQCPNPSCESKDIGWRGWTATGYREVHGVFRDETALGMQLRCSACMESRNESRNDNEGDDGEKTQVAVSTTSIKFWENKHHWQVPRKFVHSF